MKEITLSVPENKYGFFMELIKTLGFAKIKLESEKELTYEDLNREQKEFVDGLKEGLRDVELHQQGKIELQSAREFLNEL